MGVDVHDAARPGRAHGAQLRRLRAGRATTPGSCWGRSSASARRRGRDKLTLVASPAIADLGAWLEQLLAESTGKDGKGVIPIDREPLGAPDVYGDDRLFVYVRLGVEPGRSTGRRGRRARGGRATRSSRIGIDDLYDLGGELFRWEFATAVAGSVIGINPFDQPDVEASKVVTRELTDGYEQHGRLPTRSRSRRSTGSPCTRTSATRRSCRPPPARTRSRECCRRTSAGSGAATTWRCSPTSR